MFGSCQPCRGGGGRVSGAGGGDVSRWWRLASQCNAVFIEKVEVLHFGFAGSMKRGLSELCAMIWAMQHSTTGSTQRTQAPPTAKHINQSTETVVDTRSTSSTFSPAAFSGKPHRPRLGLRHDRRSSTRGSESGLPVPQTRPTLSAPRPRSASRVDRDGVLRSAGDVNDLTKRAVLFVFVGRFGRGGEGGEMVVGWV